MVNLKYNGQYIRPAQYATALVSDQTARTYYQLEFVVTLTYPPGGELVDNANESGEKIASVKFVNTIDNSRSPPKTSKVNFDDNGPLAWDDKAPPLAVREYENGKVDSMAKLKERLQLVEKNCSRLEELYQRIDTCSPHQIVWDAPSPTQSEYITKVEDESPGHGNTGRLDVRNDAKEIVLAASAGETRSERTSTQTILSILKDYSFGNDLRMSEDDWRFIMKVHGNGVTRSASEPPKRRNKSGLVNLKIFNIMQKPHLHVMI
ncbi:hypothetical protein BDR05DRAFT_949778 [Suillus weaverae]|nr:hypothetical protein BDR05DRAFT_949778 [Suillus weaverae]